MSLSLIAYDCATNEDVTVLSGWMLRPTPEGCLFFLPSKKNNKEQHLFLKHALVQHFLLAHTKRIT